MYGSYNCKYALSWCINRFGSVLVGWGEKYPMAICFKKQLLSMIGPAGWIGLLTQQNPVPKPQDSLLKYQRPDDIESDVNPDLIRFDLVPVLSDITHIRST